MAKSSRRSKTDDTKTEAKADPQRAVSGNDPVAAAEVVERPPEQDQLGPQGERDYVPEMDVETDVDRGGISAVGLGEDALTVDKQPPELDGGFDSKFDPDDLDNFLDGVAGPGGADGRNPVSGGGGPTQPRDEVPGDSDSPIGGNPYGGLEGSTGKLPPHQQAYLDTLNAEAQAAANDNDFDAANEAAAKTEAYLIEIGQNEPPAVDDGKQDVSIISNFGSGSTADQQVWDNELNEVVMVESGTKTDSRPAASEYAQYRETGTNASGDQDTPTPSLTSGTNEDRDVEDDLPDQTPELTELLGELKMDDVLGGNIDPNPTDDSAGATYDGPPPSIDPTDVVANYGSEYYESEPDASRVSAADAVPDEEFFET